MQLSIQPTRFDIETDDPAVHVTVRPRQSREGEETLVELRVGHYPRVSFRPEQAPGAQPETKDWIWNGSVADGKRLAEACVRALIGQLSAGARRPGRTMDFRAQALAALGAGLESTPSETPEALRRQG